MWMVRAAVAAIVVLLATVPAGAQILNGGFEDGAGSLDNWITFNNAIPNVSVSASTYRSGTHSAKVFGGFNGDPNYSGLQQNLPAAAGEELTATAFVRHNAGDSLVGTANRFIMKIEFYRVVGGVWGTSDMISESEVQVLDSASPVGVWTEVSLAAAAPGDTVEARLSFVFAQSGNGGGAAYLDDVVFESDSAPPPTAWTMIWHDEFDGASIDTTKWRVEDIHLNKNNELQYYAPDEVYLQNGNLVLRSRQRSYWGYDDDGAWRHFDYTSGLVETRNKFSTMYGRIEVRGKLPGTRGMWPAHWMLPSSGAWPPEIDIMELLGHDPTRVHMSHHWGNWPNVQTFTSSWVGPDFTQGFHTFAVEWWPDRITWLIDGVVRSASTTNTPQEPFYIILNTAVGGSWPGNPDGTTVFPQYHEIDYVRVYAADDVGTPLADIKDTTATTAITDGDLWPSEYIGSTNGINSGLADRIGEESLFHIDSSANSRLSLAFESFNPWSMPGTYGAVIYIDSQSGGFASTENLVDAADRYRRMASGVGLTLSADLFFAPGFLADYAIVLGAETSRVFELGTTSHTQIGGADLGAGGDTIIYEIDDGSLGLRLREFSLRLDQIGVAQGDSFDCVVTFINGDSAFRSNEFVGVAPGNSWDGANIGPSSAVLKVGDFLRFETAASQPCGVVGDVDCTGYLSAADAESFVVSLLDPDAYAALHPDCPACAGDVNQDGFVDGRDISEFVSLIMGE